MAQPNSHRPTSPKAALSLIKTQINQVRLEKLVLTFTNDNSPKVELAESRKRKLWIYLPDSAAQVMSGLLQQ